MRFCLILIALCLGACANSSGAGAGIVSSKPAPAVAYAKVMSIVDYGQQSPPHHRIARICAARGGLVSRINKGWTQLWPTGPSVRKYSFSCEER